MEKIISKMKSENSKKQVIAMSNYLSFSSLCVDDGLGNTSSSIKVEPQSEIEEGISYEESLDTNVEYASAICENKFVTVDAMFKHMNSQLPKQVHVPVENDDTIYNLFLNCNVCGEMFIEKSELLKHMKSHESDVNQFFSKKRKLDDLDNEQTMLISDSLKVCICGFRSDSDDEINQHKINCEQWSSLQSFEPNTEVLIEENNEEYIAVSNEPFQEYLTPITSNSNECGDKNMNSIILYPPGYIEKQERKRKKKEIGYFFLDNWLEIDEFRDWLQKSDDPSKAYCKICSTQIKAEISTLKRHMNNKGHLTNVRQKNLLEGGETMQISKVKEEPIYESSLTVDEGIWEPMALESEFEGQVMQRVSVEEDGKVIVHGKNNDDGKAFERYVRFWDKDILPSFTQLDILCQLDDYHSGGIDKNVKPSQIPKFNEVWLYNTEFQPWLVQPKNKRYAFCNICRKLFTATIAAVRKHSQSNMHDFYVDNVALRPLGYEQFKLLNFVGTTDKDVKEMVLNPSPIKASGEPIKHFSFNASWLDNDEFMFWIDRGPTTSQAFCMLCQVLIPACVQNLRKHMIEDRHRLLFSQADAMPTLFTDAALRKKLASSTDPSNIGQYKKKWFTNPDFQQWLGKTSDPCRLRCTVCSIEMKAEVGMLRRHMKTKIHIENMNNSNDTTESQIDDFTYTLDTEGNQVMICTEIEPEGEQFMNDNDDLLKHVNINLNNSSFERNSSKRLLQSTNDSDVTSSNSSSNSASTYHECEECCYKFLNRELLSLHLHSHNVYVSMKCYGCDYVASSSEDLDQHTLTCMKSKVYQCPTCYIFYDTVLDLVEHVKDHGTVSGIIDKLKCPMCPFRCGRKIDMKIHQTKHIHPCLECNYKAITMADMKNHKEVAHSNTSEDPLAIYEKKSISDGAFSGDLNKSFENNYKKSIKKSTKCLYCRKRFRVITNLEYHIRNKHPQFLLRCSRCDFSHHCEEAWAKHMTEHERRDMGEAYAGTVVKPKNSNDAYVVAEGENTECVYVDLDDVSTNDNTVHVQYVDDQRMKVVEFADGPEVHKPPSFTVFKKSIKTETVDGEVIEQCILENEEQPSTVSQETLVVTPQYEIILCKICNFSFTDDLAYQAHVNNTHPIEFPHICSVCQFRFDDKNSLKKHSKRHSMKLFECDQCSYSTEYKNGITRHMRCHKGNKPYSCNSCNKRFFDNCTLKRHLVVHMNIKPYGCNLCDYKANTQAGLNYHMKQHTRDEVFKCSLCPYETFYKVAIDRHIKKHTGVKDLKCIACDFATNDYTVLKRHMYRHGVGEKNHVCDKCGFRFYERSTLKRHMKVHQGALPFQCKNCDFKCNYKGTLTKHMASNHDNQTQTPQIHTDAVATIALSTIAPF